VTDGIKGGVIHGWALRSTQGSQRLQGSCEILVVSNGETVACERGSRPRHDVAGALNAETGCGFDIEIPAQFRTGQYTHFHCYVLPERTELANSPCIFAPEIEVWKPDIRGVVDGAEQGVIRGWALRSEQGSDRLHGRCDILIVSDGLTVARGLADRPRQDVGGALNAEADCGFHFRVPAVFRKSKDAQFRCFIMPERIELAGSPCKIHDESNKSQARLRDVSAAMDEVFLAIGKLRRSLNASIFQDSYDIDMLYDDWARRYLSLLRSRVDMARARRARAARAAGDTLAPDPLVSIICPTYKPDLGHFAAMVASVRAQTYANWELILIDDGSKQPTLTAWMTEQARADPRIRPIKRRRNGGISAGTNDGIAAARGEWIALLDHDDELVDVAVEVMIAAQRETGARMLYSDEDKLTASGRYVEPAFKPDFNLRLLLGQNYICHFLLLQTELARAAGPFKPEFDGAQDHDFMLRLSEIVPRAEIHHVPEILYHWRKAAGSTAGDASSKPKAAGAGIAAIQAYLNRHNLPGIAETIQGSTRYRVVWRCTETPSVNIVIPFRDQAEMTQRCIDTLFDNTAYSNFEITLVDNGSTEPSTLDFIAACKRRDKVRIISVNEPFNFSRLCNIGARANRTDFVLFLNNDVFVEGGVWLQNALAEALADPEVAIVGGKFLYPSRRVQHGGIVLGIGGVAGHIHTHLEEAEAGFTGRALVAQELSAVTGAGLLMRMAVFEEIGGFDEVTFTVDYNDVDLCLRARAAGYKVIWTPDFLAEHHESLSRGSSLRPDQEERFFMERQAMIDRWGSLLARDPFYSPHFDLYSGRPFFELLAPTLDLHPQILV
jgi:GT2 family glycosyltransferase